MKKTIIFSVLFVLLSTLSATVAMAQNLTLCSDALGAAGWHVIGGAGGGGGSATKADGYGFGEFTGGFAFYDEGKVHLVLASLSLGGQDHQRAFASYGFGGEFGGWANFGFLLDLGYARHYENNHLLAGVGIFAGSALVPSKTVHLLVYVRNDAQLFGGGFEKAVGDRFNNWSAGLLLGWALP